MDNRSRSSKMNFRSTSPAARRRFRRTFSDKANSFFFIFSFTVAGIDVSMSSPLHSISSL